MAVQIGKDAKVTIKYPDGSSIEFEPTLVEFDVKSRRKEGIPFSMPTTISVGFEVDICDEGLYEWIYSELLREKKEMRKIESQILEDLESVVRDMKANRPFDRGERSRAWAICITEAEKLAATWSYLVVNCQEEE